MDNKVKWRLCRYTGTIERRLCERETDVSIFVAGSRYSKRSEHSSFHDTWESAHDELVGYVQHQVKLAKEKVTFHQHRLDKALAMARPNGGER